MSESRSGELTLFPASSPPKNRFRDGLLSFEDTGHEQSKSKATLGFTLACKRLQSSPCFPSMSRQPTFSTTSKHNIAVPAPWI